MPDEGLIVEARGENLLAVKFTAMASPCEVLLPLMSHHAALAIGTVAALEAWRVEKKYSRYRDDSVTAWIHENRGTTIEVDEETASLIDFAKQCYELSEGLFDITSGVLRRVWRFDGSDRIPTRRQVREVMPFVGWRKVTWRSPQLMLPAGMEIDLGGLGKEYAVDSALLRIQQAHPAPALVNFGGDLRVSGPRRDGARWGVAIEAVDEFGAAEAFLDISDGALTTSGDARRLSLIHI